MTLLFLRLEKYIFIDYLMAEPYGISIPVGHNGQISVTSYGLDRYYIQGPIADFEDLGV